MYWDYYYQAKHVPIPIKNAGDCWGGGGGATTAIALAEKQRQAKITSEIAHFALSGTQTTVKWATKNFIFKMTLSKVITAQEEVSTTNMSWIGKKHTEQKSSPK